MMCYPPSGYITFSLRKLKFYGARGPRAGGRGPDVRAGGWGLDNPNTQVETTSFLLLGIFGSASSTFLIDLDFVEQCLKAELVGWIGVLIAGALSLPSFDSSTVLPEREKFLLIPALVF